MKRLFLSAVICGLFTPPLSAQEFLQHVTVAVGAGFSFPAGVTADHTKTGFNFVASGGPRFNRFSLGLDFSLHYLDVKNSLEIPETNTDLSLGSIMRLWSLTVNPSYEFIKQERFSSYATGGYGLYNRKLLLADPGPVPAVACDEFWNVCVSSPFSSTSVTDNLSPYKGGYNVGGGVTFGAHTKFFVEVRYHHMFTTNAATEVVPLTFGIRW
jgi:opacity protein-like surface antigen